ncbi:hypothetical protein YWS52_24250 [Chitiniphilus shinanonensis]
MKPAYYNEHDRFAAQWLRNLIAAGHIAPGDVDERSIEDVHPDDLRNYTQCHFFAGIGVWSYALRLARWPDDRPVWSGSCPCQPFSTSGARAGFEDERHLWPAWHHLINERRPVAIIGEQVASADGLAWLDLVHADLEAARYTVGAVDLCAAGVGAPHIRQRLWFLAYPTRGRRDQGAALASGLRGRGSAARQPRQGSANHCPVGGLGHASGPGLEIGQRLDRLPRGSAGANAGQTAIRAGVYVGGMADPNPDRCEPGRAVRPDGQKLHAQHGGTTGSGEPGPVNGFWRDADWISCRDGTWRPVEPGTFPLADGAAARVGRLRAYGNAINAEAARHFIEVAMECMP